MKYSYSFEQSPEETQAQCELVKDVFNGVKDSVMKMFTELKEQQCSKEAQDKISSSLNNISFKLGGILNQLRYKSEPKRKKPLHIKEEDD